MSQSLSADDVALRRVVAVVGLLNLGYFFVEFGIARAIASVSLFADSIDFLEDAAVNFLILAALGWSQRRRARVGALLSIILLAPAIALFWTLWHKFQMPTPPSPFTLSVTGMGALAINTGCAFLLARYRHHGGSLTRAAFLSARNDAFANIAIVAAGASTALTHSAWPDIVVGIGIAMMNMDAAREVWAAARNEQDAAKS